MEFFLQVIAPIFSAVIGLVCAWYGGRLTHSWLDSVIRDVGAIFLAFILNILTWLVIAGFIAFFVWYAILVLVTR
jgi:hypothetical protein